MKTCTDSHPLKHTAHIINIYNNINMDITIVGSVNARRKLTCIYEGESIG